jgi:TPR repeat protein
MRLACALPWIVCVASCATFGALDRDSRACESGDVPRCIARCEAGDVGACNSAGVLLEFEPAEVANATRASGYYENACLGGYAQGCNNLAWLYLRGRGVPQDHRRAMSLFMTAFDAARTACTRGEATGCLFAGDLLMEGRGVAADEQRAIAYYRLGCDAGSQTACSRLE